MPQPLTADRLSALRAVTGYRINIRCVEGLPIGYFREIVKLSSDVYPNRDLEVTVEGTLESGAVSLSREGIDLPAKIPLARGYTCPPLTIELRGEEGRTLKVESATPALLKTRLEPAGANLWRLHVIIPAGETELRKDLTAEQLSEYISYGFNDGAIVLKSDHSKAPVIRVPVGASQFQR
jgi:hypothetical protein